MKLIVIGRSEEVIGFALAGVKTLVCNDAEDAPSLVDLAAAPDSEFGVVLLSPWLAQHAARAVDAARARQGPPVVAVIPE